MAVTWIASLFNAGPAGATNAVVNHVQGNTGDLAVVAWVTDGSTPPATPAGWSAALNYNGSPLNLAVFTRVLTGSETNVNWNWGVGTTATMGQNVYRGSTTITVGSANYAVGVTSITDVPLAGVAGTELLHLLGSYNGTVSAAPSGTTLTVNSNSSASPAQAITAREALTATGTTTARTWDDSVTNGKVAAQVLIAPTSTSIYTPQVLL